MGIVGDDERIATIRQRLADGERIGAAHFAACIANRARTDEQRREDADTLAELVRVLADALIAVGNKHSRRGRPPRTGREETLNALLNVIGGTEYDRLVTAGDIADGRDVAPRDAALLLWWAYVGPEWLPKYEAGETKKNPDEVIAFLECALADPGHEHHGHYHDMVQEVAVTVLADDGLDTVERQQFKAEARRLVVAKHKVLGATDATFERELTRRNRGKGKASR